MGWGRGESEDWVWVMRQDCAQEFVGVDQGQAWGRGGNSLRFFRSQEPKHLEGPVMGEARCLRLGWEIPSRSPRAAGKGGAGGRGPGPGAHHTGSARPARRPS